MSLGLGRTDTRSMLLLIHSLPTTIANMQMPQITHLDGMADECHRIDRLIKAIVPSLVPDYQALLDQKTIIENSMKSTENAFEVCVTDAYFEGSCGINTDPIYDAIEARLNEFNLQAEIDRRAAAMSAAMEAEVARCAAAMNPTLPAPAAADMDTWRLTLI